MAGEELALLLVMVSKDVVDVVIDEFQDGEGSMLWCKYLQFVTEDAAAP